MKLTMKKSLWLGLALALFITLYGSLGISASAQPPTPHAFYGTVEIAGQPAPAGTKVEARSGGTYILPDHGNPIITTEAGQYGGPGPFDGKLYVQGDLADGDALEFYVNEVRAQCYVDGVWVDTFPYEAGGVTELNLRTEAAEPTPGPSPTPQPTPTSTTTPTPVPTPTPGPSPTPTSPPTPGPSPTSTSAPATSTPTPGLSPTSTTTPTPGPSPTSTSPPTPGPSPTPSATSPPPTAGPSPTPTATPQPSTPGSSPTPASTSTPGPSPTPTATSKPSTPVPSPTSAPGLSPTPTTTPGDEPEGPSALLWVAIVALVVLGIAAIAFGVWGLKRREVE